MSKLDTIVSMKRALEQAKPFAKAFARLLHPFAEVLIHDMDSDTIVAIYNSISRREVGDVSYLDRVEFDPSQTVIGPYEKTNWDGRKFKSISVLLYDKQKPVGFLCVNVDISAFESARQILDAFVGTQVMPSSFKEDLYERINAYIQNYCREKQTSIEALSRNERKTLIQQLLAEGAFEGRNAAAYIGRILGVSRATIYNYRSKS